MLAVDASHSSQSDRKLMMRDLDELPKCAVSLTQVYNPVELKFVKIKIIRINAFFFQPG